MLKTLRFYLNYFNYFGSKEVDISTRPVPCQDCGACCSYFKIQFDHKKNPQVPTNIVVFHKDKSFMKGADVFKKGRCAAFSGEIGGYNACTIYENRPNVCREFPVWLPNGKQNPRCINAREHYGLKGKIDY